ncbi:MAG TPA: DUF2252 domain-containing protein [Candidatus Limnocylindrales bacterium]
MTATARTKTTTAAQRRAADAFKATHALADYEDAWKVESQGADVWTPRPWVPAAVRDEEGRKERKRVTRGSHALFEPQKGRDPIAILQAQEADRLQALVPLRHGRMSESPFAYYRGTPAVMAYDLSTTPRTDIIVQAGGDAHLGNFGIYASPERHIVFDQNDFDETFPAPWEWDVKRLATSVIVASRANSFSKTDARAAALATVRSYRQRVARYAGMRLIDVWYSGLTEDDIRKAMAAESPSKSWAATGQVRLEAFFSKARGRDALKAASKMTRIVNGHLVFNDDPPVIQHVELPDAAKVLNHIFDGYRATMPASLREFLERYRYSDFALKVVGVGSVGTRCFVIALQGRDENDPLILQAKEATASVLEPYVTSKGPDNHGQRVVHGQRLMQATSDIFLGWCRGPGGRDYYFRQLWDMKMSVDTSQLRPPGMSFYGGLCAWALAAAHARTGDAIAISAYMGSSDTFDGAVADFAETYADQNETDYRAFLEAIKAGRVATEMG